MLTIRLSVLRTKNIKKDIIIAGCLSFDYLVILKTTIIFNDYQEA